MNKRRSGVFAALSVSAVLLLSCTSTEPGPTTLTAVPSAASSLSSSVVGPFAPVSVAASSPSAASSSVTTTGSSTAPSTLAPTSSKTQATTRRSSVAGNPLSTRATAPTKPTTNASIDAPPVATKGLSSSEVVDRTAIQKVWFEYWSVSLPILRTPPDERRTALEKVASEPQITKLLIAAKEFEKNSFDNYGTLGHRPYWGPPVDGEDRAIMGDCMDVSRAGKINAKTGKALTVGPSRSNIRGLFERISNGQWRVYGIEILDSTPC